VIESAAAIKGSSELARGCGLGRVIDNVYSLIGGGGGGGGEGRGKMHLN